MIVPNNFAKHFTASSLTPPCHCPLCLVTATRHKASDLLWHCQFSKSEVPVLAGKMSGYTKSVEVVNACINS